MQSIQAKNYKIHFNKKAYLALNNFITKSNYSKIFVVGDKNSLNHCLPSLKENLITNKTLETLEIGIGEKHKTIDSCAKLWQKLCDLEADRQSLLINLGGGIVTDLGGFVATTLKRGIYYPIRHGRCCYWW